MRANRSTFATAATAVAVLLTVAGCSASAPAAPDSTNAAGASDAPVEIAVGVSPSTASAAVYLAAQKEFAEHGLSVTTETIQSGAEAIPRLLNGELAFALGDAAGTITASSNGIAISASGVATISPDDPEKDYSAIVAADPGIDGVTALEGRTIAVNQLKGIAQLTAAAAIDDQGGDSATVQFIELPFPQMIDAVSTGKVDAALIVEPFLSGATAAGLHTVIAPQSYAVPGLPSTIFVASTAYAEQNPQIVEAFDAALSEAATRLNADPDLAREVAASYTTIDPAVLATITLPIYAEDAADTSGLRTLADLMNDYGFLESQPDFSALLLGGE